MNAGHARRLLQLQLLSLLILTVVRISPISANKITINPVQIFLSDRAPSSLLTLRNDGAQPVRFQVSAFAWDQDPAGQLKLEPTEDIIFFPALLTLEPNQERKIRVGTTTRIGTREAGVREKAYRLYIEELPALETAKSDGPQVMVRTKTGIPIFMQPARRVESGRIQHLAIRNDEFTFAVENTGTVHFVPRIVRVRGLGKSDDVVLDQQLTGWYILAGGRRIYELPVPPGECQRITALQIDVETTHNIKFTERVSVDAACTL